MNTCPTCGAKCEGSHCFRHKPRKALSKSRALNRAPIQRKNAENMQEFFLTLWRKLPHYSQVSGRYLGKEPLTVFFHHILPKEKYPGASLDEENIVLLTLEEHEQVELDMYRYEEVNRRRELLKAKYEGTK